MQKIYLTTLVFLMCLSVTMAQVNISFNPPVNSKYRYSSVMDQTIKQNVMGQDMEIKQIMSFVYDMSITKQAQDEISARLVHKEVVYDMTGSGMSIKYDSKNKIEASNPTDAVMAKIFGSMIGQEFEVVFLKDGSVKSVSGMDAIIDAMINSTKNDPQGAVMMNAMKDQFSNEMTKQSLEQSMKIYPAKAVREGDSWNVEQHIANSGIALDIRSTYMLESVDKKTAMIDVKSLIDSADKKFSGEQSGKLKLDLKTGLAELSEIQQSLKGLLSANGMDISMEMISKVVAEIVEVK